MCHSGLIDLRVQSLYAGNYTAWMVDLQKALNGTYAKEVPEWLDCPAAARSANTSPLAQLVPCSEVWIQESSTLCCSTVYLDDQRERMYPTNATSPGYNLSIAYYNRNVDIMEKRIMQAGVRMAYTLNTVAAALFAADSSSSSSSSASAATAALSSSSLPSTSEPVSGSTGTSSMSSTAGGATVVTAAGSSSTADASTGSAADSADSSVVVGALVILVLLVLVGAVIGLLYWRKKKYGLSGWCDSVDSTGANARLMNEEDTTAGYSRVV